MASQKGINAPIGGAQIKNLNRKFLICKESENDTFRFPRSKKPRMDFLRPYKLMKYQHAVTTIAILLVCLFTPLPVGAKVYLDINALATRRMPVAVQIPVPQEDSKANDSISKEVRDVLASDLDFSGVFRVLDPLLYIEEAGISNLRFDSFDFADWELINAEALIKVGYSVLENGVIELEFHLYDVFRKEEMVAKKWRGTSSQLRYMVHLFSNVVMKQITGEEGVFDTSLLYVKNVGGGKEIFRMDYDGANPKQITRNRQLNLSPVWWPDGDGLVYTSYKDGSPDLYSVSLRGNEKRLTRGMGVDVGADYSPDGKTISFMKNADGNPDIYLADTNGKINTRLTWMKSIDTSPSWSPDGKRIAFVSDRFGTPQIFVMNADGENKRRITYDGNYNTSPAWSPKGDLIAYTSRVNGKFAIALADPETTESRLLVGEAGNNESPSWSPDGRFVAFSSNRDGVYQIYLVDREGRREVRVTFGSRDNTAPSWSN